MKLCQCHDFIQSFIHDLKPFSELTTNAFSVCFSALFRASNKEPWCVSLLSSDQLVEAVQNIYIYIYISLICFSESRHYLTQQVRMLF